MRKLIIAIVLLTVGGFMLLTWDRAEVPAAANESAARITLPARSITGSTTRLATRPDPSERQAASRARHKYRFLLDDLASHSEPRVLNLLARREALAPPPGFVQTPPIPPDGARAAELAEIDRELRRVLAPASYASYELFRDSDVEQYQLDEFTGGVRQFAPLDQSQERAVLEAKLRQRRQYAQLVESAGLERQILSLDERQHAQSLVESGLNAYRAAYLAEVAAVLDERQYSALSNFEATEFGLELERLQQIINAR